MSEIRDTTIEYWRNKYYDSLNDRDKLISCPHCNQILNFNGTMLDAINATCATSFMNPDRKVGQWSLFFTGYKASPDVIYVVGQAVAFKSKEFRARGDEAIPYVCAGSNEVRTCSNGVKIDIEGSTHFYPDEGGDYGFDIANMFKAKFDALDVLEEFVKTLPGSKG